MTAVISGASKGAIAAESLLLGALIHRGRGGHETRVARTASGYAVIVTMCSADAGADARSRSPVRHGGADLDLRPRHPRIASFRPPREIALTLLRWRSPVSVGKRTICTAWVNRHGAALGTQRKREPV